MGSPRRYDYYKLDDEGAWLERDPDELYATDELHPSDEVYGAGSRFEIARHTGRPHTLFSDGLGHGGATEHYHPDPIDNRSQQPYAAVHARQARYGPHRVNPRQSDVRSKVKSLVASVKADETRQEVANDGWEVATSKATRRLQKQKPKSRKRPESSHQGQQLHPATTPPASQATVGASSGQYDSISEFMLNREDPYLPKQGRVHMAMPRQLQHHEIHKASSQSTTLVGTTSTDPGPPYRCRYADCKTTAQPFTKKSDRNKHETSHGHFKCTSKTCRHSFSSWKSLDEHWAKKHASGPEPPSSCPNCSKSFTRPDNRHRHVKAQTCTTQGRRQPTSSALSAASSRTAATPTRTLPQRSGLLSPPATDKTLRTSSFDEFPALGTPTMNHPRWIR